ncbi:hypothetical protein [Paenibacillus taichungensis]
MKNTIAESFQKYNLLSDSVQDAAWSGIGGPAADALEEACNKFGAAAGITPLDAFGVIVGTLLDRGGSIVIQERLEEKARPFMITIYQELFSWMYRSAVPLTIGIPDVLAGIERALKTDDMPLLRHFLQIMREKLFGNYSFNEASVISDTCTQMENELFNGKPRPEHFKKILSQAYIDYYDHPNDYKYERIKDDSVRLAKSHYGMRDSQIEEIRLDAMAKSVTGSETKVCENCGKNPATTTDLDARNVTIHVCEECFMHADYDEDK